MSEGVQSTSSVRPGQTTGASDVPQIDVSKLSEAGKDAYASLQTAGAEAQAWSDLAGFMSDRALAQAAQALGARVNAGLAALAQGKDADAAAAAEAAIKDLHGLNGQVPAQAQAPTLDASKLDAKGQELFGNIGKNRDALVESHQAALSEGRGDIARQIAMQIRLLDAAAVTLVQHPDKTAGAQIAGKVIDNVINNYDKITAAWGTADKPVPPTAAEKASVGTLTKLAAAGTGAGPETRPDGRVEPKPGGTVTGSPDPRMDALEARVLAAENENRLLKERLDTKEKAEAEQARKPGFFRAMLEALEFLLRWFTPFINLLSAIFRILKIGYKLLTHQKIDWMEEGARLAGDIAGIFFPPIGAIANAGINVFTNKSQILGGVNELFDDAEKKNPFREGLSHLMGGAHKAYTGAKNAVFGDPKDEVERREAVAAQTT